MTEPVAPRPWYRHKAATPAAIAVLLLAIVVGLVALSQDRPVADQAAAAPVAVAPTDALSPHDYQFLDAMNRSPGAAQARSQRLPGPTRVKLGRAMCTDLNGGTAPGDMYRYMLTTQGDPQDYVQANLTVATVFYCPGQSGPTSAAIMRAVLGQAAAPAPQTIAVAATPPNSFTDGTYLVGSDMPAGNYVTDGTGSSTPSGSCYWSRNKNDGGSAGDVIKNNYGAGPGRFTAQAGEVVELKSGCTWTKK